MVPQNRSNDPSPLCCHPPVVESFPLPSAPACPGLLCPGVKNEKWWQGAGTSQQELVLSAKIGALVLGWYSRVLFSAHVYTYRTTSTFDSDCTSASQAEVGSSSDHLERKYSPCSYFYPEMSKSKFEFNFYCFFKSIDVDTDIDLNIDADVDVDVDVDVDTHVVVDVSVGVSSAMFGKGEWPCGHYQTSDPKI